MIKTVATATAIALTLTLAFLLVGLGGLNTGWLDAQERSRENPSILTLLQPRGTITPSADAPGASAGERDSLTTGDFLVRSGRRVAAWTMSASEDQRYRIDLQSADFDPYLYIVGPGIRESLEEIGDYSYALWDDDSGEHTNARICFEPPATADYTLVASALDAGVGSYSLTVTVGCENGIGSDSDAVLEQYSDYLNLAQHPDQVLSVGDEVSSELGPGDPVVSGRFVEVWHLAQPIGDTLIITLDSDEFDAYLIVTSPTRSMRDDDSGGGTNSRVAPRHAEWVGG